MVDGKEVKLGAENPGTAAEMELKLPPDLNCDCKAAADAAAVANRLPGTPGAKGAFGRFPIVKADRFGVLSAADSASWPSISSANMPAPVRITVLSLWNGLQAIPNRGS